MAEGAQETDREAEPVASRETAEPRAADADREAAAERLRIAAGEGRIDLTELEERLDRAYAAKTYAELDVLTEDLPQEGRALPGSGRDAEELVLKTRASNIKQTGRWTVPRRIVAECRMLSIVIDFTEADCAHREVTVEARCGTGSVRLIVPRGWAVRIDGSSTNTARISNKATAPVSPGAPALTLVGHPRTGRISVRQPRGKR